MPKRAESLGRKSGKPCVLQDIRGIVSELPKRRKPHFRRVLRGPSCDGVFTIFEFLMFCYPAGWIS